MACIVLFVVFLATTVTAVQSAACNLPSQIVGTSWNSTLTSIGWTNIQVNATTFVSLPITGNTPKAFSCFLTEGNTYVVESTQFSFGGLSFNYYMCLDIVPSTPNPDVVFFRIRTGEKNDDGSANMDYPYKAVATTSTNKNISQLCVQNATAFPLHFSMLIKEGFEDRIGVSSCPAKLQSQFKANITNQQSAQCPEGFLLDGCTDRSHLNFNYTTCNGTQNSYGAVNYTCLSTATVGNMTYTSVFLRSQASGQANLFEYSCLGSESMVDGRVSITKTPGTCGAANPVAMVANDTMTCHQVQPTTTTSGTTQGPSATTQAPQGTTTAGGGSSASTRVFYGVVSMVLPLLLVLVA